MNIRNVLIAITLFIFNLELLLAMLALFIALIVPVQGDALICILVSLTGSVAVEAVRAVDTLCQCGFFQNWNGESVLIAIVAKENLASTNRAVMPP